MKVLLVENNPVDAKNAQEMLTKASGWQIAVTHVERVSPTLRRQVRESFDAIMVDLTLVDTHGLNTLSLIQAAPVRMPNRRSERPTG